MKYQKPAITSTTVITRITALRTLSFLLLFLLSSPAMSQPKKALKSVFTLKTFLADGSLLGSASGVFVDDSGTALSSFTPFRGAYRAVVFDAQGKEWPVEAMLGANETYDVAKFRVQTKKAQGQPVLSTSLQVGDEVWLLTAGARAAARQGVVRRVDLFLQGNAYYSFILNESLRGVQSDQLVGCPLVNAQGAVVGLMQLPASPSDTLCYAVDARFADSLAITGLSINDRTLRSTHIKKALPSQLDQALLTLYMGSSSLDSASYAVLLDDFIAQYPKSPDGYTYRAQFLANSKEFAAAEKDMETALRVADKKDEVHYSYARLIYQKELYQRAYPYESWTLDKALQEAQQAYSESPQPVYRHQQAMILFAQKKYSEAYDIYSELSQTPLRSAELFYEASRCKERLNDTVAQLALLDSAVCMFSRPLLQEAAPYLLARAQARLDAARYRDAVNDLNDYEQLMRSRLTPNFYYIRFQAEVGGRLFQQALNDIRKAIELSPTYDLYYAEKASLEVRVGLYDDAIDTATECVRIAPEYSDGYLFLGLAQCLKGKKEEGVENLRKAKSLGDPQADGLIEKYAR